MAWNIYRNPNPHTIEVDEYEQEVVEYFDGLLLEAKFKDVKAKYAQYMGLVDSARDYLKGKLGDKGVSKYILYVMKETHRMLDEPETKMEVLDQGKDDIIDLMFNLIDMVEKFEKNVGRLKEKDIYKLNAGELETMVGSLPTPESEEKRERRKKAREESVVLYNEGDILTVRPLTEFASIYYGMATRWCISATECKNYFDDYTQDGMSFAMVHLKNVLKQEDGRKYGKIALVYDREGDFSSFFDAEDQEYGDIDSFKKLVARNLGFLPGTGGVGGDETSKGYWELDTEEEDQVERIVETISEEMYQSILSNPPTPGYEEKIEALEQEYADRIQNYFYNADVDDNYMYFSGGTEVQIPDSEFIRELPDDWQSKGALAEEIKEALDNEASLYFDDVDFSGYNLTTSIRLDVSTASYESNPDGYESFLEDLSDMDEKGGVEAVVRKVLAREGYIKPSAIRAAAINADAFNEGLRFFTMSGEKEFDEDDELRFESPPFPIPELNVENWKYGRYMRGGSGPFNFAMRVGGAYDPELDSLLQNNLSKLNAEIVKALKKQLPLPGIPQGEIKELTIPEALQFNLLTRKGETLNGEIAIVIDDLSITEESLVLIKDVITFIDKQYESIVKIAVATIQGYMLPVEREIEKKKVERLDSLQDVTKDLLRIAEKHKESSPASVLLNHYEMVMIWARGEASDEAMLNAVTQIHTNLIRKGLIPQDYPEPQSASWNESLDFAINSYLGTNIAQKTSIVSEIEEYLNEKDLSEEYSKTGENEDEYMKYDHVSTEDLLNPDVPAPWEAEDE